jgi:hypothetical protein
VDAGAARRHNRAILDARLAQTQILAGDTVALDVTVGNFSGDAFAGRVTVTVDQKFSFDQEISIAPWSEAKVTVPVSAGGSGVHLCEVRLPADALEWDNRFCLTLAVGKGRVLIVTDGSNDPAAASSRLRSTHSKRGRLLLPRVIASTDQPAADQRAPGLFHPTQPAER